MAKIKKTLGDINSPQCQKLMHLIESQNQITLANWAIDYATNNYLPIYQKSYNEAIMNQCLICKKAINDKNQLKPAKEAIKQIRNLAKEFTSQPEIEASIKAIATACATIVTPSNALGFLFYGNAALAYDTLGLKATDEEYAIFSQQQLQKALDLLKKIAIQNEKNPVKIKWSC